MSFYLCLFVKVVFYLCPSVRISFIKYILETSILKYIFWGSNFEEHFCSEIYFLREQLFWSLWLLISLAAALYFLSKFSQQVKAFAVLISINTSLELSQIVRNQARYVSGGIWLEWLLLRGKLVETFIRLRSQGGVPVTQGSGLKNECLVPPKGVLLWV